MERKGLTHCQTAAGLWLVSTFHTAYITQPEALWTFIHGAGFGVVRALLNQPKAGQPLRYAPVIDKRLSKIYTDTHGTTAILQSLRGVEKHFCMI